MRAIATSPPRYFKSTTAMRTIHTEYVFDSLDILGVQTTGEWLNTLFFFLPYTRHLEIPLSSTSGVHRLLDKFNICFVCKFGCRRDDPPPNDPPHGYIYRQIEIYKITTCTSVRGWWVYRVSQRRPGSFPPLFFSPVAWTEQLSARRCLSRSASSLATITWPGSGPPLFSFPGFPPLSGPAHPDRKDWSYGRDVHGYRRTFRSERQCGPRRFPLHLHTPLCWSDGARPILCRNRLKTSCPVKSCVSWTVTSPWFRSPNSPIGAFRRNLNPGSLASTVLWWPRTIKPQGSPPPRPGPDGLEALLVLNVACRSWAIRSMWTDRVTVSGGYALTLHMVALSSTKATPRRYYDRLVAHRRTSTLKRQWLSISVARSKKYTFWRKRNSLTRNELVVALENVKTTRRRLLKSAPSASGTRDDMPFKNRWNRARYLADRNSVKYL